MGYQTEELKDNNKMQVKMLVGISLLPAQHKKQHDFNNADKLPTLVKQWNAICIGT